MGANRAGLGRSKASLIGAATLALGLVACGGGGGGGGGSGASSSAGSSASSSLAACSVTDAETALGQALSSAPSSVDFSLSLERSDGRRFTYQRGSSTMDTVYESASTSKLVTSVVILRLVEQGYLSLDSRPQDFISDWPIPASDPLRNATLAQLLSFTSGIYDEPTCLNNPLANFATCVNSIATKNVGNGVVPGSQFYYASTHMQVAGLMAIRARGFASWQQVFDEFKTQTGQFAGRDYDLPSLANPRLAGGMHWSGTQYLDFLHALRAGNLLGAGMLSALLADRTGAGIAIVASPAFDLNEQWHYGLGLWHECQSSSWNCTPGARVSSPGAYGAYPFWDRNKNYIGMLARQGALGSYASDSAATERAVRPQIEAWAACQ